MVQIPFVPAPIWNGLAEPAEARASGWIDELRIEKSRRASGLLSGMRQDPESFEFTRRLVELVAGTEDAFTSALGLREMAQTVPDSMPLRDRIAMRAGGVASLGLPWAVMPVARKWLRDRVSHLVLAAKLPGAGSGAKTVSGTRLSGLAEVLRQHSEAGCTPVVEALGEGVHGPGAAEAEIARLVLLAGHPGISHLVVDPARIAPGGDDWSADHDAERAAQALRPLFEAADRHGTVIHLQPRSVRWARLLPDVLARGLADPVLDRVRVGVRLVAELPEAREHYDRLSRWAQRRVAEGGAPAEVVIGLAGLAGAERIAAILSGLAVSVLEDPVEVRAQLLRLAELALHPGRAAVLKPVIASEDPLTLAAVHELAQRQGTGELFAVQLRSGVAPGLGTVLTGRVSDVRISLPVISPKEFGGAVDLLVAYAAEAADPGSVIAVLEQATAGSAPGRTDPDQRVDEPAAPGIAEVGEAAERVDAEAEDDRASEHDVAVAADGAWRAALIDFREAVKRAPDQAPPSHRTQLRAREWDPSERDSALFYRSPDEPARFETGGLTAAVLGLTRGETGDLQLEAVVSAREIPVVSESGFANEPATDAGIPANREWVRGLLATAAERTGERDRMNDTVALSPADLDPAAAAEAARDAGAVWARQSYRTRAVRLRRTALAVVAARDRLLQTLAVDTGAPVDELDAAINDIVDAARYCGQLTEGLQAVRGAEFVPDRLVLVTADDATSFSAQVEAVLAALAAGSGVLWSVPQRLFGSAVALLEEWEVGGLTQGAVRLEAVAVGATLPELAASPSIDRAVVLGSRTAARELARRRPGLRIEGRFRARGSMLITSAADIDPAIGDLVASAFRGAGTDARSIHCAILLGGISRSRHFREGLADAVNALRVGDTARPGDADPLSFDVGPLPAPPSEAGLRALTELGRGEEWLVQPRRLDDEGLLWSPGVRLGVPAASSFWDDACGVPVLGVTYAHMFEEAVRMQNAAGSGTVAGLQSNDADEVLEWLDGVEAAALSINRPTTGARIERQPGGAWNDASMGLPALAGGPNWLVSLGSWQAREGTRSDTLHLRGLDPEVRQLIETVQEVLDYEQFDALRRAALADALTWRTSFGVVRDAVGLGIERNTARYWPVATQVRLAEDGELAALVRVIAAALVARTRISISTGEVLPAPLSELLEKHGIDISLERDDDWLERLAAVGALADAGTSIGGAGAGGAGSVGGIGAGRIRLIGGDRVRAAEWLGGPDRAALWAEPVTMAGPVELLTMLREQSISARAHRHSLAVPVPGLDELLE